MYNAMIPVEYFYELIKAAKQQSPFFIIMTNEQREIIENQLLKHESIIIDLYDEIDYHEREMENLQTLLDDDSNLEDAVNIKQGR